MRRTLSAFCGVIALLVAGSAPALPSPHPSVRAAFGDARLADSSTKLGYPVLGARPAAAGLAALYGEPDRIARELAPAVPAGFEPARWPRREARVPAWPWREVEVRYYGHVGFGVAGGEVVWITNRSPRQFPAPSPEPEVLAKVARPTASPYDGNWSEGGSARERSAPAESRGEAILADAALFPEGFLAAWRDYSGRQPYEVPSWRRPRASDVAARHGAPDLEVTHEIGSETTRLAVYGDVALGLERDVGEEAVAWVAAWRGEARTDGPPVARGECAPGYDGRWSGSSGVGPLSFTVANHALTRLQIQFAIQNGGCQASGTTTLTFSSPLPISGTNLLVSIPAVPQLGFTFRGALDSSSAAAGTLNLIFIPCNYNGTSAWAATNRTFGLCILPNRTLVGQGEAASFPVEVLSIGGFSDPVGLAATVSPSGANVTASLASTTVAPGGATTLTVTAAAGTPFGDYTVSVTGASGADSRTRSATVTVSPPDFALAIDPAALTVNRKQKGSIPVTVERIAGFTGDVTVTAPDTKPIKVKLTPGSQTTTGAALTFDFKVKKKAAPGVYEIVFTGRDAEGRVRTATLTMTVQ